MFSANDLLLPASPFVAIVQEVSSRTVTALDHDNVPLGNDKAHLPCVPSKEPTRQALITGEQPVSNVPNHYQRIRTNRSSNVCES